MSGVYGAGGRSNTLKARLGYYEDVSTMPIVQGLEGVVRSAIAKRGSIEEIREMFRQGELEAALLPTTDAIRQQNVRIIPGSAISAVGASRMFFLVSKRVMPTEINHVMVDMNDLGGIPLAQMLLARKMMIRPEFHHSQEPLNPQHYNLLREDDGMDAYILVGRNSLMARKTAFAMTLDLTYTWYELTRLPYVLHCWVVRRGHVIGPLDKELADVARRNEKDKELADKGAQRLGVSSSGIRQMYEKAFHPRFDATTLQSIRTLGKALTQSKVCSVPPIQVYQAPGTTRKA